VPNFHRLAERTTVAFHALPDERWIQGWGDTGGVLDTFAAAGGFTPRIACRSSDYRFMSALVSAGVGIALVPRLALPRRSDLRDLALSPSSTRYVGAYQPVRGPHQAADELISALRAQAAALQDR
jgi:DNA-binding transcriptional LysR family regulator